MKEQLSDFYHEIKNTDYVLIGIGDSFPHFSYHQESDLKEKYKTIIQNDDNIYDKNKIIDALNNLYEIVKDKNYFILSMNTDDIIYDTKFDEKKIVCPCGSDHMLQCTEHILERHETIEYFNHIKKCLLNHEDDFTIPICPVCNKELKPNTIKEKDYLEAGYLEQWKLYKLWLASTLNKKLTVIELDMSFLYPGVFRFPIEKTVFFNHKAKYFRVNKKYYQLPEDLNNKGVSIIADGYQFLEELNKLDSNGD